MKTAMGRRAFLGGGAMAVPSFGASDKPAILGGEPVRRAPFPEWPRQGLSEEEALVGVLRSGHWGRTTGRRVSQFEAAYAKLTGAKYCVATANGTSALIASLNALGVGPGDEVVLPPYTFVATLNVILMQHALPVFVDSDVETFQIDARKIGAALTGRTAAIVPVHIGGALADLDTVLATARPGKLPVIEDACQAHLGEWRGKKAGTLGDVGCFSFQSSKNLNSGEGGAVITSSEELAARVYAYHTNGRAWRAQPSGLSYVSNGANLRLTEFQAALLMTQMERLEEQSKTREQNAAYLTKLLREIPGIHPARVYDGCTRNAWHLYMFRFDSEAFAGLTRTRFLKALEAEGVPASEGYSPLNREPFLERVLGGRHYRRIFGEKILSEWKERTHCPANDRLCGEAVWLTQTMLLGPREDMDQIAAAVRKIHAHGAALRAV